MSEKKRFVAIRGSGYDLKIGTISTQGDMGVLDIADGGDISVQRSEHNDRMDPELASTIPPGFAHVYCKIDRLIIEPKWKGLPWSHPSQGVEPSSDDLDE